ncbi:MAG: universal stress protein [Saprospiraceae bacterium]
MKRKILVPVDFSPASRSAYLYAREMAKIFNCLVEVVHAYRVPYAGETVAALVAEAGEVSIRKDRLKKFINNYHEEGEGRTLTKVEVRIDIREGDSVPVILQKSKDEEVFLTIMGTAGKHLMGEYILGSVASAVAQRAKSPVLLIPENVSYRSFHSILYASNFESAQPKMLNEITNFANLFRAAIHFVHVQKPDKADVFSATQNAIFEQLFDDREPGFAFHMETVASKSVVKGLNEYAEKKDIDLIVLVNRQNGFLDSITEDSTTKKMALDIKYPLMVYRYSED